MPLGVTGRPRRGLYPNAGEVAKANTRMAVAQIYRSMAPPCASLRGHPSCRCGRATRGTARLAPAVAISREWSRRRLAWTGAQVTTLLVVDPDERIGMARKLRVERTRRHECVGVVVPMSEAGQMSELVRPQQMVGKARERPFP